MLSSRSYFFLLSRLFLCRFAVGQTIGQAMIKYKLTENPEPSTFSKEEIDKYFGGVGTRIPVTCPLRR